MTHLMTSLELFNNQPAASAHAALRACCASTRWSETLALQRPFLTPEMLVQTSTEVWFTLSESDWLEAFAAHPRIGETRPITTSFLTHSQTEQSATQGTLTPVAEALLAGNHAYEDKFGFRYIVFASGRTAPELLAVLGQRLTHIREQELREAAAQQDRITQLRLQRWLQP